MQHIAKQRAQDQIRAEENCSIVQHRLEHQHISTRLFVWAGLAAALLRLESP